MLSHHAGDKNNIIMTKIIITNIIAIKISTNVLDIWVKERLDHHYHNVYAATDKYDIFTIMMLWPGKISEYI